MCQTAQRTSLVVTEIGWHSAIAALRKMLVRGDPTRFCEADAVELESMAVAVREIVKDEQQKENNTTADTLRGTGPTTFKHS